MNVLSPGQASSLANPALVFYSAFRGTLQDPVSLAWAIYDTTSEANLLNPLQVASGTTDLVADKIGTGRFVAPWVVPGNAAVGLYEIRWTFVVNAGDPPTTVRQSFEVAPTKAVLSPYYCALADIRAEGVTTAQLSDARAMLAIQRASQFVERVTGRFFEPRYMLVRADGTGSKVRTLGMPLIAIDTLNFVTSPLFPSQIAVEPDFYRVYNRHLDGQVMPDDRNDPKIELFSSSEDLAGVRPFSFSRLIFPRGQHNILVQGVWGFTDPDGSPFGRTPEAIRRVTQLLVLRDMAKLSQFDAREDATRRGRIISEGTRDQHYQLDSARNMRLSTAFTGDPEIDQVLAAYLRPPMIGGV